jgi:pseudaminic acid synthase
VIIKIKNIKIGYKYPPIIIAEISGNHNGNKKKFLELIKSACLNGADLIKIQTYEPKDITLKGKTNQFYIKKGIWKNKHLWNLYKKACTPFSWHNDAFEIAKKYKKIIFSTPFSLRAVDFLENLGCELYKIASFEITDLKLIRYVASKKKPIIISTGMATTSEIKNAIKEIKKYHNKIIIMHCVSSYPTKLENTNLKKIKELKLLYKNSLVGLSDHTNDIVSSIASIPLEVVAIEKHFKINNKIKTSDSTFSITPEQLKKLKSDTMYLHKSLKAKSANVEKISKNLRRSIYAKKKIKKNYKLTYQNIETLRPFIGICASKYFRVLNKKAKVDIKLGQPIFQNMIKN